MAAVWLRVRSLLRSNWRATIVLSLIVGVTGGAVLAALAGARRTNHAVPDFISYSTRGAVGVSMAGPIDEASILDDGSSTREQLAALPGVKSVNRVTAVLAATPQDGGTWHNFVVYTPIDDGWPFLRVIVVKGRLPSPDRDEVVVNEMMADQLHLHAGDHLRVGVFDADQFEAATNLAPAAPAGPGVDVTVSAIVRGPADVQPREVSDDEGDRAPGAVMFAPYRFWHAIAPETPHVARYGTTYVVDLARGTAGAPQLRRDLDALSPGGWDVDDQPVPGFDEASLTGVRRQARLEAAGLLLFAVVAAIAAIAIIGQAIVRQLRAEGADTATLRALGLAPGDIRTITLIRCGFIAVASAVVATIVAIAASPLSPIGVARRAERHPGLHVDGAVLAPGALVLIVVLLAGGAAAGWLADRPPAAGPDGPNRVDRLLSSGALPASATFGLRLARPRRRAGVGAVAVGVAAIVAASTFAASVARVGRDPARFGVTWDAAVGSYTNASTAAAARPLLDANPNVARYVGIRTGQLFVDERRTDFIAVFGDAPFPVVDGRAPQAAGEIALGTTTARKLHKHIGDSVRVWIQPATAVELRVVGRVSIASPDDRGVEPGKIALLSIATASALGVEETDRYPDSYIVFFDGAASRDQAVASLRADFHATTNSARIPPTAYRNIQQFGPLTAALAALLAALSAAIVAHATVVTLSRRRRDFAVLSAMGLTRAQRFRAVAWHATFVSVAAAAIGVAVGVVAGRLAWQAAADEIGFVSAPVVPIVIAGVTVVGAIAFLNAVAAAVTARADGERLFASLRAE